MQVSSSPTHESDRKRNAALFILKTRDGRKITQTCLDGVLSDVSLLVKQNIQSRCHTTLQALKAAGASKDILEVTKSTLFGNQGEAGLFDGLKTEYLQNSHFRDNFGLVVSDISINFVVLIFLLHFRNLLREYLAESVCK